jgi:hypothetical protein
MIIDRWPSNRITRQETFADLTDEYDEWLAQEKLVVGAHSRPCYPDGMP